jgi:Uma2 family endonuclease
VEIAVAPHHGPYRYADLASMPDDGQRYELVDGALHVSPSPVPRHQIAVLALTTLLDHRVVSGLLVLPGPVDVMVADDTVLVPDLVVAAVDAVGVTRLVAPPRVVVEVLSPSTRRFDRLVKAGLYAEHGIDWYLLVDPDEPRIEVLRRRGAGFEAAMSAAGDEVLDLVDPFPVPVRLTPSDLLARLPDHLR